MCIKRGNNTMNERPVKIKFETNTDSEEQRKQRLAELVRKCHKKLLEKGYPYLFK